MADPAQLPEASEPAGGGFRVGVGILLRRARLALLVACAAGLVTYWLLGRSVVTTYEVTFQVRHRAGSSVVAGLSSLVGNLPSLLQKDTVETQFEILRSEKLLKAAYVRAGLLATDAPDEVVRARTEPTSRALAFRRRPGTDIFTVHLRGTDPKELKKLADALRDAYQWNDVAVKRAKDTELQRYLVLQIGEQEKTIARFREVLKAHREVEPLEKARDTAAKSVESLEDQLRAERRKRTAVRDGLLAELQPAHPKVVAAEETLAALVKVLDARSADDLTPHLGGTEAQWAGLRLEALEEDARRLAKEQEIDGIRGQIGGRFTDLLRTGEDPEQVRREYALAQEAYEGLKRRLGQVKLSLEDVSSDIEILAEPTVRAPGPLGLWLITGLVALAAGLVAPFVVESLVIALHTVPDLERATRLPTLAVLPRVDAASMGTAAGGGPALVLRGSASSDALRMLRTNVESALDYPARRLLLVASAEPGEGKSLIAANLAATYAEMGLPTLLVDLDLRRPAVHEIFRVRRGPGVSDVLAEGSAWRRAVQIPGVDHLHILPAGSAVDDAGGLLAAVRLTEILDEMRQIFSVVICDSPALLAVADAALVARRADAVLMVYALGTTPSRSLQRAQGILTTARANILGVVANDLAGVQPRAGYYAYYGKK